MSRYYSRSADRFDNYRQITARFNSVGACGHGVAKGEQVGYHRSHGVQCAACWAKWQSENAEAAMLETSYTEQYGDTF